MNNHTCNTILAVIALTILSAAHSLAQTQPLPQPDSKPVSRQTSRISIPPDLSKTGREAMNSEPHRVLTLVYLENIAVFTKALRNQAQGSGSLSADFARAIVAEINRSYDKSEDHHRAHGKLVSEALGLKAVAMLKAMDGARAKLKDAISSLEKDVLDYTMRSPQIVNDTTAILRYLDELSKIY